MPNVTRIGEFVDTPAFASWADPALSQVPNGTVAPRALQIGIRWFTETAGGAARYYYHLLPSLAAVGMDVRGLVLGGDRAARETDGRIEAFVQDGAGFAARLLAARRSIGRLTRTWKPDLVASHFAMFAFPALDLIRPFPYVVHFHGPWAAEARAEGAGRGSVLYKRAMEMAVYRSADRFVVLSEAFGHVLTKDYGVGEDRVRVIPGGVDCARFDRRETEAEARALLGWSKDRPVVVAVRRLAQRMGLDNLISAMSEVRRQVPESLLIIAGRGPQRGELDAQVAALGLADHVRFLGFVADDDLPLVYRAADIAIMPSRELEGFGLTAIEALAAGTPVLVTPVGGLPEVVRGLDPALVLPGSEARHLAYGIVQALKGRACLPDSARCMAFVRNTYDWPIIARAVSGVYRELL